MARITVINMPTDSDHDVAVHAEGCGHASRQTKLPQVPSWSQDWTGTMEEFVADYNSDFGEDSFEVRFYDCAKKVLS